jgi:hypothetical protein
MSLIIDTCTSQTQQTTAFFQQFSFDTLLALISCVTGIIALFLGGSAYHHCKVIKKSFNDDKKYNDSSVDNSQKAVGNIYNQNCDVNSLVALTNLNFETTMKQACNFFEKKAEENLLTIVHDANQIILEQKLNIATYTKIDWINVYLESAKTSSDTYMQYIWAKVLAKELASPNSFSFKTLDVLKNMSSDDFRLFEKLLNVQIDGYILKGEFTESYYNWDDLLKMRELGIINLDETIKNVVIQANGKGNILFCNAQYAISIKNHHGQNIKATYNVYLLTSAGMELLSITEITYSNDYVINFAKKVKEQFGSVGEVTFHKVNSVNGNEFNYNTVDLFMQ